MASEAKLLTLRGSARAISVAQLRRRANDSGLTQEAMGARIGTDAKGVRRLLAHGRKRADRLDLFFALNSQNCHVPQPAPGHPCTRFTSEGTSCVQGWATTPQGEASEGEASEGVARKAAA